MSLLKESITFYNHTLHQGSEERNLSCLNLIIHQMLCSVMIKLIKHASSDLHY